MLAGERRAAEGFIGTEMHQANKDLHSPSTLALLGAEQGAYALLGPFGIGLDAAKMMMKGSNANSARVLTASLLSSDNTPRTKRQFLAALRDKDYFVRAASARALGNYRGKDVSDALQATFTDKKPSVGLTAAASYIRVNRAAGSNPKRRGGHLPHRRRSKRIDGGTSNRDGISRTASIPFQVRACVSLQIGRSDARRTRNGKPSDESPSADVPRGEYGFF